MSLAKSVLSTLRERKETLAVAESVTGGGISNAITEVEGASHSFLGGVVAYSRESKVRDLSIAENIIDQYGIYSEEVALAMARGVRSRFDSDWAISTTGVGGPGDSHGVKPGSIWVAFIGPDSQETLFLQLTGTRQQVRIGAVKSIFPAFERILSRRTNLPNR
jgi:nicotinamide-nucleotide amidase